MEKKNKKKEKVKEYKNIFIVNKLFLFVTSNLCHLVDFFSI